MRIRSYLHFRLLIILFFIILKPIYGQNHVRTLDSLKSQINSLESDSTRFRVLVQTINKNLEPNPEIALSLSFEAENLALKNKWKDKNADSQILISRAYSVKSQFDSSLIYAEKAIINFKSLNNKNGVFRALANEARSYFVAEDFKRAIEKYLIALELENEVTENNSLASVYGNIGLGYQYTGSYHKALEYHLKGLKLRELYSKKHAVAGSHDNLGINYFELGEYEKALEHYNLALDIYKENHDTTNMLRRQYAIGGAFYGKGEYKVALDYLNGALTLAIKTKRIGIQITCYQVIGLIHIKKDEFEKAQEVLRKAESIFPAQGPDRILVYIKSNLAVLYLNWGTKREKNKNNHLKLAKSLSQETLELTEKLGFLQLSKKSMEVLYKASEELGEYKQAMDFVKKYIVLNDSLLNSEKQKEMVAVEAKYETEKKDLKIDLLSKDAELANLTLSKNKESHKRQQYIIYSLFGAALLVTFVGLIVFRLYKQKQKINSKLEEQYKIIFSQKEENETLLKEIHHRVKNNLQVISSLLDLQSDNISDQAALSAVEDGQSRVKAMALIHQNLYQNKSAGSISFRDYCGQLTKQLAAVYSFGKKIEVIVEIGEVSLDIDTAIPLGLILNELVSNSYKHAFEEEMDGEIKIRLEILNEGEYCLIIKDNGPGLEDDFNISKTKSLGLRLVHRLSRQLYGKVEYIKDNGANFQVYFKGTEQRKQIQ